MILTEQTLYKTGPAGRGGTPLVAAQMQRQGTGLDSGSGRETVKARYTNSYCVSVLENAL